MLIAVESKNIVVCIPNINGIHDPPFQMINNVTGEITGYYMDVTKKILAMAGLNYTYNTEYSTIKGLCMCYLCYKHYYKEHLKKQQI